MERKLSFFFARPRIRINDSITTEIWKTMVQVRFDLGHRFYPFLPMKNAKKNKLQVLKNTNDYFEKKYDNFIYSK